MCRGNFLEGINFKNDLSRGIFMIGVPNLYVPDPKLQLKKEWYQRNQFKFSDTYKNYYERHTI